MADPQFFTKAEPMTIDRIASLIGAQLQGAPCDAGTLFEDVAPLHTAGKNQVGFLDNPKYVSAFEQSEAGACIVAPDMVDRAPAGMTLLVTISPYKAYAKLAQAFYPEPVITQSMISDRAAVSLSAHIGKCCVIEPGVFIGDNVIIGDHSVIRANAVIAAGVTVGRNTVIGANVSLTHCRIGDFCRILPGARIGQEGFGFHMDAEGPLLVPQLGRVIIGNNVMVGANTTIDRGAGPDTVIGDGTMIDNLVQIGHNVQIGKCCIIVAQVGISGSTKIGDFAVLAGQAGVAGHLTIGSGARIGAQAGIMRDVPPGSELMGSPGVPVKQFFKQVAKVARLATKEK